MSKTALRILIGGLILVALSIPLDPEDPVTAAIGLYLIAARLFTWWRWQRRLPKLPLDFPTLEESDRSQVPPSGVDCEDCLEPIRERRDLVVIWRVFSFVPMHGWCWARSLRGLQIIRTAAGAMNGVGCLLQFWAVCLLWVGLDLWGMGLDHAAPLATMLAILLGASLGLFLYTRHRHDRLLPADT